MMLKAADYFGDKTIGDYKADGRVQAGFFNYLGGNVWYANYVAYIVAAIIILLAAAASAVANPLQGVRRRKSGVRRRRTKRSPCSPRSHASTSRTS